MNYFKNEFLQKQRLAFISAFKMLQANIGTKEVPIWVDGEVLTCDVNEKGEAIFQVAFVDLVESTDPVCELRLIDQEDEVAAQLDKNLAHAWGEGIYVTLKILINEVEMEVV